LTAFLPACSCSDQWRLGCYASSGRKKVALGEWRRQPQPAVERSGCLRRRLLNESHTPIGPVWLAADEGLEEKQMVGSKRR